MSVTKNPSLKNISFLVGQWNIKLTNASFLAKDKIIEFSVSYNWVEDNSAISVWQGDRKAKPPQSASWIIGRDEASNNYTALYADNRGVSRVYMMSYKNYIWHIWRDNPSFSQRFSGKVSTDKKSIKAKWEKSLDGGKTWDHDFDLYYKKIK